MSEDEFGLVDNKAREPIGQSTQDSDIWIAISLDNIQALFTVIFLFELNHAFPGTTLVSILFPDLAGGVGSFFLPSLKP